MRNNLFFALLCSAIAATGCQAYSDRNSGHFADIQVSHISDTSVVTVFTIVGLPQDTDFPNGLAHYTEHLVWKNIENVSEITADQHSNAWTNHKTIGYRISGEKEDFSTMLKQLLQVFEPIAVSPTYAEKEADIVLREREYRLDNNVGAEAYLKMNKFIYAGNANAESVIGEAATITKLNLDSAIKFHDATHKRKNAVLAVIGDISTNDVAKAIKTAQVPKLSEPAISISSKPFLFTGASKKDFTIHDEKTQTSLIWRKLVKLDKAVPFEALALESRFLSLALESNLAGGLAGPLRYQSFIANSFSVQIVALDEQHVEMHFSAFPDTGISLKQLEAEFLNALSDSFDGIPQSTFDRLVKRDGTYQPDWQNAEQWQRRMGVYLVDRLSMWRQPLSKKELQRLGSDISLLGVNNLLSAFKNEGRQSTAYIKKTKGEIL